RWQASRAKFSTKKLSTEHPPPASNGEEALPLNPRSLSAGGAMFGLGSEYNYSHFTKELLTKDLAAGRFSGPEPGDRAPDFELRSLEGDSFRLSDFRGQKNLVLTFGSATCPMTAGSVGGINKLAKKFGDAVQFVFIYAREAHPGDSLPAHSSIAEKVRAAELLREEEEIDIP